MAWWPPDLDNSTTPLRPLPSRSFRFNASRLRFATRLSSACCCGRLKISKARALPCFGISKECSQGVANGSTASTGSEALKACHLRRSKTSLLRCPSGGAHVREASHLQVQLVSREAVGSKMDWHLIALQVCGRPSCVTTEQASRCWQSHQHRDRR